MIYWLLFRSFFEVGALSFGGGYGMIPLLREKVVDQGWLTDGAFLDLVAVSEATPGPIAVNMATFVGSREAGLPGALLATLGAVLPSVILMLIVAVFISNALRRPGVRAVLSGIRPCVAAMILSTALIMFLNAVVGFQGLGASPSPDAGALVIGALLVGTAAAWKALTRKVPSPIVLLAIAAVLGLAEGLVRQAVR